jgi:CheY-like chemotaxis protein
MLSGAGYQVDAVLNGAEAVEAVTRQRYDAILMDCQMPQLNGYEATARIRALEAGVRRTPIIAMTAGARVEDRDRCLAAGMDSYLAKPFSKSVLLSLVAGFLDEDGAAHVDTLETAVIEELASFGEDYLAELVNQFRQETDGLLAELRVARENGSHASVRCIAHSVKGSSAQLGGRRLARSCDELEQRASANTSLRDEDLRAVEQSYGELCRALTRRLRSTPKGSGSAA